MDCWVWYVDPVLIDIWGPIKIRYYGLGFLCTFVFGYWILNWQVKRSGRDPELAANFVYWGFAGVLGGSWFGHRLFYEFDRVLKNPLYLIDIRGGLAGLASHGATIGLILAIILFARRYRVPVGEWFDRFSFAVPIGAIFVRSGNFFNSEIIGRPSDVPWAVCLLNLQPVDAALTPRHPSQLYEVANGIIVLAILLLVDRLAGRERRPNWLLIGTMFISYMGLRFIVEFFKEHQTLAAGSSLTMGQYLSIPFFLVGVGLVTYALKFGRPTSEVKAEGDAKAEAEARRESQKAPSPAKKKRKKR